MISYLIEGRTFLALARLGFCFAVSCDLWHISGFNLCQWCTTLTHIIVYSNPSVPEFVSRCVQLLVTEPLLLLVLGCGTVCHQILSHVTQYHSFVVNSKHSCSDSHTHLLCFSLLWLAVCCGPCGFYAPQLYRQVLLRRVLAMGILSVRLSVCHNPVVYQAQVR